MNAHTGQQKLNLRRKEQGTKGIGSPAGNRESFDEDETVRRGRDLRSWRERETVVDVFRLRASVSLSTT